LKSIEIHEDFGMHGRFPSMGLAYFIGK